MSTENGTPVVEPFDFLQDKWQADINDGCCSQIEMGITPPSLHVPGAKDDKAKPRLGLVFEGFALAIEEVGKVGTFGANKYTDNGWASVPNGQARYTDAMYRHLMAQAKGEAFDEESNLLHAAHTAWNALARLELELRTKRGRV